jgi:hypothetical protein
MNSLIESSDSSFDRQAISILQSSLASPRSYNSIFYKILALSKGKEKSSDIRNTTQPPSVSSNPYQYISYNKARE